MNELLMYCMFALLMYGYGILVCWFAIHGCDQWWEPFVFGAIFPFMVIYEYWTVIAATLLFFAVLIYLPILCARCYFWIAGVFF